MSGPFGLSGSELEEFCDLKSEPSKMLAKLDEYGGPSGLADLLRSNAETGLTQQEADTKFSERRAEFGENIYPAKKSKNIVQLWIIAWKDETIIILTIAAFIALILGVAFPEDGNRATGWIDGGAIIGAVVLVCTVTAINDYNQERLFRNMEKDKEKREIKVIRDGDPVKINSVDLQVGDIVEIQSGQQFDKVPADGIFIDGNKLEIDESAMTGEPVAVKKNHEKPFLLSGCQAVGGSGHMLVTAVGSNSIWGKTLKALSIDFDDTPLQKKLGILARNIGLLGLFVAVVVFIVLMVYWVIDIILHGFTPTSLIHILDFFIIAITIIVVAVPEGLPLAVTIALAYSMKKMVKDNNFVKHLKACETMGGATDICSDKTGTLTLNRMEVKQGYLGNQFFDSDNVNCANNDGVKKILSEGIAINTTAGLEEKEDGSIGYVGYPTECSLLLWIKAMGLDYKQIRDNAPKKVKVFEFTSARKRMSTVIEMEDGGYRLYFKGASEITVARCTNVLTPDGDIVDLDDDFKETLLNNINEMASQGFRTLGLAYRDFDTFDVDEDDEDEEDDDPPEQKLTLVALVGIEDPIRPEVPEAVARCKKAGITVRMVTGDNILTAKKIAEECGIYDEENGGIAIEGHEFAKLTDEELDEIIPNLQVIARCQPNDKERLVSRLMDPFFHLVAVTGDGTNDAPALKKAHVGCAMGSGTEVAKEAADIIILDDNFNSIVLAVMWGRSIFDNIRKFLQFQLTVNFGALAISFIGAVTRAGTPLRALQLLWVNLIMDSMGALALATEPPELKMLDRPPINVWHKKQRLLSNVMWANMLGQSAYQVGMLCLLLYVYPYMPFGSHIERRSEYHFTLIFNAFVWCQIFNEINSRKVNGELNCLKGFFTNYMFISIILITIFLQVLIVEFGSIVFKTTGLGFQEWVISILVGLIGMPVGVFLRLSKRVLPKDKNYAVDDGGSFNDEEENGEEDEFDNGYESEND
eukprot:TRINITY_DN5214_c2_g1_i1.p1 TRINITY_DN5214_c2_g1~~TRINITY_DN5214_c2_g1_i1.p1  ORF type:complete len:991 (-),score=438.81 TRINITY_DN5214_c2_g1_i1:99-3038(-)